MPMNNGPLGTATRSTVMDRGTLSLNNNRPSGVLCSTLPTEAQVRQYAAGLAHQLSSSIGSSAVQTALFSFLGNDSFSAGVVYGVTKNIVVSVYELGKLFKMLALAEYHDVRHAQTFWQRVAQSVKYGPAGVMLTVDMYTASLAWPKLDRMAESAAQQRDALVESIKYSFEHPGSVWTNVKDSTTRKYEEFNLLIDQGTLAGNFKAGVLFGEILLDVLLIVDGVTALARLATRIPELLKLLPSLRELAPALRTAVENSAGVAKAGPAAGIDAGRTGRSAAPKAAEGLPAGRALTQAEKDAAQNSMKGTPPQRSSTTPADAEPEFTKSEKGVYGEAQADTYMDEQKFQKLNGDVVKAWDPPLGKGIDGVWKNTSPPPEYVITEAKYGSSRLGTLKDGTKQMSDDWVDARLNKAVGENTANAIRDADARGQVEKWLLHVDENGNITKSLIDESGNIIARTPGE